MAPVDRNIVGSIAPLEANDDEPLFEAAWQAEVLAIADAMVTAGHFSPRDWSETLGAERRAQLAANVEDTPEAYYSAAVAALERLTVSSTGIGGEVLAERRETWRRAYLATPHGAPVVLEAGQAPPADGSDS